MKVRLDVDLTDYSPGLIEGIEGVIKTEDNNFCLIYFPSLKSSYRILRKSFTIIDEEYLLERERMLLNAKNVHCEMGIQNGFKYIKFDCVNDSGKACEYSTNCNIEGKEIIEFFKSHNIPIKTTSKGRYYKLLKDRKDLHPSLTKDCIGLFIYEINSIYSVNFHNVIVKLQENDIIQVEDPKLKEEREKKKLKELEKKISTSYNIKLTVGTRGGFKSLSFSFQYPFMGKQTCKSKKEWNNIQIFLEKYEKVYETLVI